MMFAGEPVMYEPCKGRLCETFTVCMTKLRLVLELEPMGSSTCKVPVVMVKAAAEASLHDWSSFATMQG